MTEPLSPAAQAVLKAANGRSSYGPDDCLNESRWIAAAALRAVADQVVPENIFGPPENVAVAQREITRAQLLSIADELEALP